MKNFKQEKLSQNARIVINKIKTLAGLNNFHQINGLFLIQALSQKKGSLGEFIMSNLLKKDLQIPTPAEIKKLPLNFSLEDVLIKAFQIASISKVPYVGTEHIFHAFLSFLIKEEPTVLKKYFDQEMVKNANRDLDDSSINNGNPKFINEMQAIIENFFSPRQGANRKSSLREFGTNLNQTARKEKHILVGRENELERISNILGRKNKNNPVLIGEPGVGKTAIVEGLAQKINQGKSPYYLNNKQIINLDLGLMIAGTNFRGEFEARLKQVIREASDNESVILFIDEIHTLIGAGNAMGGMDAANLLKPALSRGNIQVIGATTLDEYRKNIEKDAALERRFQTIFVSEPSLEEGKKILRGIKPLYEKYHNIKIDEETISLSVELAKRYFPQKFLPDSAIDLIDESSAKKRTNSTNIKDYTKLNQRKETLQKIINEKESSVIADRYEEAIILRNQEQKLKKEIVKLKKGIEKKEKSNPIKLDSRDILETISQSAKIPMELLTETSKDISTKTKKHLEKKIIGQKKVIKKIHDTLLRRSSGISDPNRPLGSFLFLGASGVGKTLTAKSLAEALSPVNDNLIQINMSEFMEKHSVSKLLGAPAGYIGYDEDKSLMEKVRQNPYSVVLFDEIEKADQNLLNILLQILDEGRITDAKGRLINFKNTILILTSNIGTSELNQLSKIGFDSKTASGSKKEKVTQEKIIKELNKNISQELLGRLDNILVFNYLNKNNLQKIAKKEFRDLEKRLKKQGVQLAISKEIFEFIAQKSFDPGKGARLIKKEIEKEIEPLIAEKILSAHPKKIQIKVKNKKITIEN